jgi:hypothetical protein
MAELETSQISALRRAIDCLPTRTREAMLVGISNSTIVVGAYTHDNGVCPMLAAHRNGGRTDFVAFARSWDEYCFRGVRKRKRRARLATPSELATLRAHIEASLLADEEVDLVSAMTEHRQLVAERQLREPAVAPEPEPVASAPAERVRPGDPDRSHELSRRPGWRWLRIMRSYDEFEQAMAELDEPNGVDDARGHGPGGSGSTAPETEPEIAHLPG